jgi:integrase
MEEWIVFKTNGSKEAYENLSSKNKEKLEEWLRERSIHSKSAKREDNRKRVILKLLKFLNKDWDKMTYEDYVNIALAISKSKLSTNAKNDEKSFIKRFLKDCFDDWKSKFKDLELLKSETVTEDHKIRPSDLLTEIEIEKLIQSTSDMKKASLIAVLHATAGRPEEIVKLKYSDCDFPRKQIYLYSGKTKRRRAVYIGDTISFLVRLKKETNSNDADLIFPSVNGGIITISGLNYILKTLGEKAGIKKKINAYLFRHTRLSYLITKLSPKVYEEVSGHSLQMGMKTYAHLSQDKIIKEMKEKVFEAEEIPEDEREKLENEIKKLKEMEKRNKKRISDIHKLIQNELKKNKDEIERLSK